MSHQIAIKNLEEIKSILELPKDQALKKLASHEEYSAFMLSVLNAYSSAAIRKLQTGEVQETKEDAADSVSVGTSFKITDPKAAEVSAYISCLCCNFPKCDCC